MGYRDEIEAANRQGRTRDERWDLRAAVREKYGMGKEKRKRGGVAGAWDRNKHIIEPLATTAAGVVAGPWAGAALGAAMGGLDREGKGGVGFDVGQGLRGGALGYGLGSVGSAVGNKLGVEKLVGDSLRGWQPFAGKAASPAATVKTGPTPPGASVADVPGTRPALPPGATPAPAGAPAATAAPAKSLSSKVLGFMKDNPQAIGGAFSAAGDMYSANANRSVARENNRLQERMYEDQYRERAERAKRAEELYRFIMGNMSSPFGSPG